MFLDANLLSNTPLFLLQSFRSGDAGGFDRCGGRKPRRAYSVHDDDCGSRCRLWFLFFFAGYACRTPQKIEVRGKLKVQPEFQKFRRKMGTSAELSKLPEKIEIFRRKIQIVSGTPDAPAEIRNFSGKIKSSAGDFRIQRKIQIRRWKTKTSAGNWNLRQKVEAFRGKSKSSAGKLRVQLEN